MEVTEIILAKVSRLCQLSSHSMGFFQEMEVTEIILAKVSRLCQLSSHSHGFLSRDGRKEEEEEKPIACFVGLHITTGIV